MAKRKKTKKTTKTETALSLVTLTNTPLDLNDVLAVVTSTAEQRCHAGLSDAKRDLKSNNENVKNLEEAVRKQTVKEERAAATALAKTLRKVVEAAGGKVKLATKNHYDVGNTDDNGRLWHDVAVTGNTNTPHYDSRFRATAKPSPTLKELQKKADKAGADVKKSQEAALSWRQKLNNVPLLERAARAKVATKKLAETKDGQQLLKLLTADFEAELLALPGN